MHPTKIRVRLSETDENEVVYYSQYFVYFDVAKCDFLRSARLDPPSLRRRGLRLLAAETHCRYYKSAKFDDLLDIRVWTKKLGNSSAVFEFEVKRTREKSVLADGYLVNVLVDMDGKPVAFPEDVRRKLARYLKK
jgi:acyl-CoA thioester hydrolase